MTSTATPHLRDSDTDQAWSTTRQTELQIAPTNGSSNGDHDLSTELEEAALRRLRSPGKLLDAGDVLPELNQ